MVTPGVELDLRQQLKEAGRLLSNPPASVDELLHILDQTEKLLSKVDQSPNNLMQEALNQPIKALVHENLLKHSNVDVKVSVASCLCEITRITAPDAPYTDEEMKGIFQCIVSSFENLSDKSSRSYHKRASILETVSKVRSCVIMLDLECDELIVKMFEHFLNSVRDHHLDNIFSLMMNIMAVVIEESEDISFDMLKPLLASIKNNSEGVLPVARKLGEEVFKRSADKLRFCINKAVTILGDSLDDYSQVLTSICQGTTDFVEHNDESASVQPKADETTLAVASSDAAGQVMSNGKMVTGNEKGSDNKDLKKPEKAVDHPVSNQTSKLDNNDSVAEKSENMQSRPENQKGNKSDTITKSAEPSNSENVHGENKAEKSADDAASVLVPKPLESEVAITPSQSGCQQEETEAENAGSRSESKSDIKKGIRSKKNRSSQTGAPSTVVFLTKVPEGMSDTEMSSAKRLRKKTPKAEDNKPSATSGSDVELLKKPTKKLDTVDPESKKLHSGQDDAASMDALTKAPEGVTDSEMRSPKRVRKKTPKAATSGSDVEPPKKSTKKVDTVVSGSKKKSSGQDDAPSMDVLTKGPEGNSDSDNRSLKRVRKKTPKAEDNKPSATSGSDVEPPKKSTKKVDTIDTGSKLVKRLGKKVGVADSVEDKPSATSASDVDTSSKKLETVDSGSKLVKRSAKKVGSRGSVANKRKLSGKKESELKKSKQDDKKVVAGDSEGKPAKQSLKKDSETDSDAKPLKLSGKKGGKSKAITEPSEEDVKNKDEETDSDSKPLEPSENTDEETDSGNKPLMLSAKKGNKSSSLAKSSSKNKDGKKQGRAKNVEEKDHEKSSSDDDGMDMPLKSALEKVTKGEGNLEKAVSSTSKRKRSIGKNKVAPIKHDDSLVGKKVQVWWPDDKMYYEGVVESFDSVTMKHKVQYNDGDEEELFLKDEKWEILQKFSSTPIKKKADDTDVAPESSVMKKRRTDAGSKASQKKLTYSTKRRGATKPKRSASKSAGSTKGKGKVDNKTEGLNSKDTSLKSESVNTIKSKEGGEEELKEDGKKQETQKIVYTSRGRKGSKTKTKAKTPEPENETDPIDPSEPKSPSDNVKEKEAGDAAEDPESEKVKSAETSKMESKSGKKRKKTN